jgi:anthranilate phosphoribosyltransferase
MKPFGILPELTAIVDQRVLTSEEIGAAAKALLDAAVGDDIKAAFLRAWTQRGEAAAELAACAEAFLPQALDPGVRGSWKGKPLLDCCGTGGGGLPLLNISTGLMFILAAMDVPVVKHGNRGLTKKSGSADVLEALGIKIDLPPDQTARCLEEVGCAFLFAPAYHLSFASVGPARRQLAAEGQRTIFNLLGPLLNPARPDARLVGVFKEEHLDLYEQALRKMSCPNFTIVCGEDAGSHRMLGEASAHGRTRVRGIAAPLPGLMFDRTYPDAPDSALESLLVSDATESAKRLIAILCGEERSLARSMLIFNAALAAFTQGAVSLEEGLAQSAEALDSGRAYERLQRWRDFSERSP